MKTVHDKYIIKLTWTLLILLYLGRAYQAFFFDLPFRTLFWDESLMKGLVEFITGDSWHNYVINKSVQTDRYLIHLQYLFGLFWLLCAFMTLVPIQRLNRYLLGMASLSFLILALLYWKEKYYQWGQLFEYAIQICTPLVFLILRYYPENRKLLIRILKLSIGITFFCHGLYAIGFYIQPDDWKLWTMNFFHFQSADQAEFFLKIVGFLDILVVLGLLFKPTMRITLMYCVIWGFATASARVLANFYLHDPLLSIHQYTYESLYRICHGGIPLILYLITFNNPKS